MSAEDSSNPFTQFYGTLLHQGISELNTIGEFYLTYPINFLYPIGCLNQEICLWTMFGQGHIKQHFCKIPEIFTTKLF